MSNNLGNRHSRENANLQIYSDPSVVEGYGIWDSVSSAERAALNFAIKGNSCVLDIGCGTGRLSSQLDSDGIDYHGIDLSAAMIKVAKTRFPKMDFNVFDAFDLNPNSCMYDCILFMHNGLDLLYPYKRRMAMLEKMVSVLNPNGKIVFSSHVPDWDGRSSEIIVGFSPHFYRFLKNLTKSQCGFVPENYRGKILWQYRSATSEIEKELNIAKLQLQAIFPDNSRCPPDWNYYVATQK